VSWRRASSSSWLRHSTPARLSRRTAGRAPCSGARGASQLSVPRFYRTGDDGPSLTCAPCARLGGQAWWTGPSFFRRARAGRPPSERFTHPRRGTAPARPRRPSTLARATADSGAAAVCPHVTASRDRRWRFDGHRGCASNAAGQPHGAAEQTTSAIPSCHQCGALDGGVWRALRNDPPPVPANCAAPRGRSRVDSPSSKQRIGLDGLTSARNVRPSRGRQTRDAVKRTTSTLFLVPVPCVGLNPPSPTALGAQFCT
jgi:hypothetical protein